MNNPNKTKNEAKHVQEGIRDQSNFPRNVFY